jgi:hypothetical protein
MVINIMQNTILINYMDAQRWKKQMVAVIGGNARMVKGKDMEQWRGLVETDTSGNTWMVTCTGMEYADGLMDKYIKENWNRIIKMAKDISDGQMAMNIGERTKMARNRETESNKRREYYIETNTKKTSVQAEFKYSEVLQPLSRNR